MGAAVRGPLIVEIRQASPGHYYGELVQDDVIVGHRTVNCVSPERVERTALAVWPGARPIRADDLPPRRYRRGLLGRRGDPADGSNQPSDREEESMNDMTEVNGKKPRKAKAAKVKTAAAPRGKPDAERTIKVISSEQSYVAPDRKKCWDAIRGGMTVAEFMAATAAAGIVAGVARTSLRVFRNNGQVSISG